MKKVCVVTVTFNSSHYVEKQVKHLLNQSTPVDHIVIVDNNSRPEHKVVVESLKQARVTVLSLPENLGGAGGFEAGMKYAYEHLPFDFLWIMDDDAFPNRDTLEQLLKYSHLDKIGALVPLIYGIDLEAYQLFHHKKVSKYLNKDIQFLHTYDDVEAVTEIDANAFVGPLFSYEAVKNYGFADGGLFIYGDDTEYTYRISRHLKLYLIKDAVINHKDAPVLNGASDPKTWWKLYYQYRNKLLFIHKFGKSKFAKWQGRLRLKIEIFKKKVAVIIKKDYKGYRKLRLSILKKAYRDGKAGLSGKTIDPGLYIQSVK